MLTTASCETSPFSCNNLDPNGNHRTVLEAYTLTRKRGAEAGASNLQASVADGELLLGFDDEPVDAAVCTGELKSMINYAQAIRVSTKKDHRLLCSFNVRDLGQVCKLYGENGGRKSMMSQTQAIRVNTSKGTPVCSAT